MEFRAFTKPGRSFAPFPPAFSRKPGRGARCQSQPSHTRSWRQPAMVWPIIHRTGGDKRIAGAVIGAVRGSGADDGTGGETADDAGSDGAAINALWPAAALQRPRGQMPRQRQGLSGSSKSWSWCAPLWGSLGSYPLQRPLGLVPAFLCRTSTNGVTGRFPFCP